MAKDLISRAPVLSYYDPLKELTLENDACEYGLEAALIQEEPPVAYGLEKFHYYTHGRKVNVFHRLQATCINLPEATSKGT